MLILLNYGSGYSVRISLEKQWADLIREYREQSFNAVENALDEVSLEVQRIMEQASPVGLGPVHFRDSWDRKMQYKGVRYVGNTKLVSGSIPLSNILEYSRRGRPFIRRTWEANKELMYQKFKKALERRL